jgi:hypothetical protein
MNERIWLGPPSVQIQSDQRCSCIANHYSIHIDHWDETDYIVLEQGVIFAFL